MAIGSKYNPLGSEQKLRAERIFTDRVKPKDAFRKSIAHINEISKDKDGKEKSTYKVLSFYGMGGIGKTSLREHLCDMIKKDDSLKEQVVYSYIDFQTDFSKNMISKDVFYRLISDRFHKNFGIKFTIFSLAYIIYLKKLNPNLELKKHTLPFAEEGDILSGIIEFLSESVGSIAGITTKIVAYAYKNYSNFFLDDNIKNELVKLENQELYKIEQELSRFFAYDLANFKKENPNKKVAIFFDTYELLCKTQPTDAEKLKQDEWIRDFVEQNKNVLFVISGREKLIWELADSDWEEVLEQHRLEELSDDDCRSFLNHCGITDPNIQERIIKCSCGVPFYLDICVEIWEKDKEKEDFKDIKQAEITERLIRYLDRSELATLELLSIASYFNREIFELMVSKFSTGYPATKIDELAKFSFISSEDDSKYTIQRLMKECLQNQLNAELRARAHEVMICYYEDKLKDLSIKTASSAQAALIQEAFAHKEKLEGVEKAIDWLLEKLDVYSECGMIFIFKHMLLELLDRDLDYKKSEILSNLGTSYYGLGDYSKAIEYHEKALEITKNTFGDNHPSIASSYNSLGVSYDILGDHHKAIEYYKKAFEIIKNKNTPEEKFSSIINLCNNLGASFDGLGDYYKAIECYEKGLEVTKNVLGENHSSITSFYNNLGVSYKNLGDHNKAIEYCEKALEITKNTFGDNYLDVATSYNNLANSYLGLGDYYKAIECYEKGLEITKNTLGENHPDAAYSYNGLANSYNSLGDYNKAIEYSEKALEIRINTLGENHPEVANFYNNLASTYFSFGDCDKAFEYYKKALEIAKNTLGEYHPDVAAYYTNLGTFCVGLGDYYEAIWYYEKSIEIIKNTLGENHPTIADSYNGLGNSYRSLGDYSRAIEYHKKALEIIKNTLGENHPTIADSYNGLGNAYLKLGNCSKSIECYTKAIEIKKIVFGDIHPDIATFYYNLGLSHKKLGDYNKAIWYYEKALEIIESTHENNTQISETIKKQIAITREKLTSE
ncbi:tetratricopeptide repeat protein [Campylobacter concisus]|uniref:tetratricopeptide repeat protein n=1 Tax=Campylobacter concisus TaxID=199 RepID=UPI00122D0CBE|nr:tetratricopeptide repeat protein [Campylobacter concisus]